MSDVLTPEQRARCMAAIGSKNTTPELRVRRMLHALGARFRLHRKDLPGTPDIVLPGRKLALFVHGCYWHRHPNCRFATTPGTRQHFWQQKFDANMARDRRAQDALRKLNWQVTVIWECQTRDTAALETQLRRILHQHPRQAS